MKIDTLNLKVELIHDVSEREKAQALVYTAYMQEKDVSLSFFNGLGGKVVDSADHHMRLVDNFSERSLMFGLYYKGQLIGCIRGGNDCDQYGHHEVDYYIENRDEINANYNSLLDKALFLSRFIIQKEYRHFDSSLVLARAALMYCYQHKLPAVGVALDDAIVHYHDTIKFNRLPEAKFFNKPEFNGLSRLSWLSYEDGTLAKSIACIEAMLSKWIPNIRGAKKKNKP